MTWGEGDLIEVSWGHTLEGKLNPMAKSWVLQRLTAPEADRLNRGACLYPTMSPLKSIVRKVRP